MEAQYPNEVLIAIDFAPKDLRNPTKYPSRKCFDFLYFTTYKMNIQDINVESKLIRKLKGGGLTSTRTLLTPFLMPMLCLFLHEKSF